MRVDQICCAHLLELKSKVIDCNKDHSLDYVWTVDAIFMAVVQGFHICIVLWDIHNEMCMTFPSKFLYIKTFTFLFTSFQSISCICAVHHDNLLLWLWSPGIPDVSFFFGCFILHEMSHRVFLLAFKKISHYFIKLIFLPT